MGEEAASRTLSRSPGKRHRDSGLALRAGHPQGQSGILCAEQVGTAGALRAQFTPTLPEPHEPHGREADTTVSGTDDCLLRDWPPDGTGKVGSPLPTQGPNHLWMALPPASLRSHCSSPLASSSSQARHSLSREAVPPYTRLCSCQSPSQKNSLLVSQSPAQVRSLCKAFLAVTTASPVHPSARHRTHCAAYGQQLPGCVCYIQTGLGLLRLPVVPSMASERNGGSSVSRRPSPSGAGSLPGAS